MTTVTITIDKIGSAKLVLSDADMARITAQFNRKQTSPRSPALDLSGDALVQYIAEVAFNTVTNSVLMRERAAVQASITPIVVTKE